MNNLKTIYPKHYFWVIYTHYDEVLTKYIRWNHHDKTFTFMFDIEFTMKSSWQNIYEEVLTKHIRSLRWRNHDKSFTKKSWQNIYVHYDEEVLTKHIRWRNHDKSFTFMFDKAYTMKKSWKFMRWEKRWEKRLDLTSSPKIYFWIIYTHYDEEIMTKHLHSLRWRSHDKTFTMKKSWQNIYAHVWQRIYVHYDEVSTKHIRWNHDKTYTMKKSWQNIYEEIPYENSWG